MTRRERLENKLAKREEWAEGRRAKASAIDSRTPDSLRHDWAFITQPGHIPERARMNRRDAKAIEHRQMANHHDAKADGLARRLETTIFSDDPDAIEALEAKAQALEAKRARRKRVNAAYRAFKKNPEVLDSPKWADLTDEEKVLVKNHVPTYSREPNPWPPYSLTNIGARIRQARKRIETIKARAAKVAEAEAAGGVTIKETGGYAVVTFAEKPSRDILNALRSAGYSWGGGSWVGPLAKLPDCVRDA